MSRMNFHGPKDVQANEVLLYLDFCRARSFKTFSIHASLNSLSIHASHKRFFVTNLGHYDLTLPEATPGLVLG